MTTYAPGTPRSIWEPQNRLWNERQRYGQSLNSMPNWLNGLLHNPGYSPPSSSRRPSWLNDYFNTINRF